MFVNYKPLKVAHNKVYQLEKMIDQPVQSSYVEYTRRRSVILFVAELLDAAAVVSDSPNTVTVVLAGPGKSVFATYNSYCTQCIL